jgi:hypothetical protein
MFQFRILSKQKQSNIRILVYKILEFKKIKFEILTLLLQSKSLEALVL